MFLRRWFPILALILMAGLLAAQEQPAAQEPESTEETVNIKTRNGQQMDVWLNGKRAGLTPLTLQLEPGTYFLTAGGDGLEPIMRPMLIQPGGEQLTSLNDRALEPERMSAVADEIMKAFRARPGNPHIRILAALITTDRKDHTQLLESLPPDLQSDPTVLLSRARWALTDGDPNRALSLVDEGLHREARLAGLWRMKAWILVDLGRADEAKEAAESAVRLDPMHADSFVARGDALSAAGEEKFARLNYERALDLQPGNRLALRSLGRVEAAP